VLKEVAGIRVYENRRIESKNLLTETLQRREKIEELLEHIDTRLQELEEEKDELKEYTTIDREKRCLEYTLYQRELQECNTHLTEVRM